MELTVEFGTLRYPISFVFAFGLAAYLTPLIRRGALSYGVVDRPDGHLKRHDAPVAYLGGVAIYLAFLSTLAFTYVFERSVLGLLLSGSIIVMLGLFDDLKVLSPPIKLAGQAVAALVLIKAGVFIQLSILPAPLAIGFTFVWLLATTNAINLIDVSDGLAAGVSSIVGLFLYAVALINGDTTIAILTLCLVGSTLGFLVYNRPPALIYLGDTGSMFLGFMLGALAMRGHYTRHSDWAALVPAVLLGVPIFDTIFIMAVRAARGLPVMQGSPDHFAVRLRNHGMSSGRIAVLAYGCSTLLGALGLGMMASKTEGALLILAVVVLLGLASAAALLRLGRAPKNAANAKPDEML